MRHFKSKTGQCQPLHDRTEVKCVSVFMTGLTGRCQVNYKSITNIDCPVLIGATEDLNQVPYLWFLIILEEEKKDVIKEEEINCFHFNATLLCEQAVLKCTHQCGGHYVTSILSGHKKTVVLSILLSAPKRRHDVTFNSA